MKKVMFVDDEVLLALGAEASLQAGGYEVRVAFDGEEALREARVFEPDVIVTDFMMPKMDGADLAKALRNQGISVPIVVLTAVPEGELEPHTRSLFASYLEKPVQDGQLLSCISALIGH